MTWTYVTQLSELIAESAAEGRGVPTDHHRPQAKSMGLGIHGQPGPWQDCLLPNLMAETWGYIASAPLSPSLDFHQSINPTSLLVDLLPRIHLWLKVVMRVQMKTCSQLVGRGKSRGYTASSKMYRSNLNNTYNIISGLLPGVYPPCTKQPALAFYFISIPSFVHHVFFKNGAVVVYVQVCLLLSHTFYTYCFVTSVFPCCGMVRCTNFLNVLLT